MLVGFFIVLMKVYTVIHIQKIKVARCELFKRPPRSIFALPHTPAPVHRPGPNVQPQGTKKPAIAGGLAGFDGLLGLARHGLRALGAGVLGFALRYLCV
jgi:hypothetical protein